MGRYDMDKVGILGLPPKRKTESELHMAEAWGDSQKERQTPGTYPTLYLLCFPHTEKCVPSQPGSLCPAPPVRLSHPGIWHKLARAQKDVLVMQCEGKKGMGEWTVGANR